MWHYGDPLGEQRAAERDAVVIDRSHRAVLALTGAERLSWLHALCTQHVADLRDGAFGREIAAQAMGITADRLRRLRLVDEVIREPLGGAHRDPQAMAESLKGALIRHLAEIGPLPPAQLLERRRARLRGFGVYGEG